jgi:hypothetical protein
VAYTALVRTGRYHQGHYAYDFETPGERKEFVKSHPQVWWYFFPEEDEFESGWHKGGAWKALVPGPEAPEPPVAAPEVPPLVQERPEPEDRW